MTASAIVVWMALSMSVRISGVTWAPASVSTLKRSKVVSAAAWRVTSVKRDLGMRIVLKAWF
jgi:hypothetical protein